MQAELAVAEGDVIMLKLQAEGSAARKVRGPCKGMLQPLLASRMVLHAWTDLGLIWGNQGRPQVVR